MKKAVLALVISSAIIGCKSKKVQNLPKDIALKPPHEKQIDADREAIAGLKKNIDSLANSVICTDPAEWRISPIGSKPCGGPAAYMAYPIKVEKEILPEIEEYTHQQADFNRRNRLMSDCAIVPAPSGIKCEGGKAVLIKGTADAAAY